MLGTPEAEVLEEFKSKASHMDFNFPTREGVGIDKQIPHVSAEAKDLINKLLTYKAQDRITAT